MDRPAEAGEILLSIPAQAVHCPLVSVGAAAVAERQKMPRAEVDEIRDAVDQALAILVAPPAAEDVQIHVRFAVGWKGFRAEFIRSDQAPLQRGTVARLEKAITTNGIAVATASGRSLLRLSKTRAGC